jgi:hypothetical protein
MRYLACFVLLTVTALAQAPMPVPTLPPSLPETVERPTQPPQPPQAQQPPMQRPPMQPVQQPVPQMQPVRPPVQPPAPTFTRPAQPQVPNMGDEAVPGFDIPTAPGAPQQVTPVMPVMPARPQGEPEMGDAAPEIPDNATEGQPLLAADTLAVPGAPKIVPLPQPFAIDGKEVVMAPTFNRYDPSEESARLMEQPPGIFIYNDADFVTVLRALADQARMSFIVPPEMAGGGVQRLVTCAISGIPPFEAMQNIAESQGFNLEFRNGIWFVITQDNAELYAKTYQIRFNPMEIYDANSAGGGGGGQASGSPTGLPDTGINPQFTLRKNVMLENIEKILAAAPTGAASAGPQLAVGGAQAGGGGGGGSPQVAYNEDESSFFIIGTQKQHEFIAQYLAGADKPMKDIAIEAKFFETNLNPKKELGIDWSGTFGGDGYGLTLSDLTTSFDMNRLFSTFTLPTKATLTADDVRVAIKAMLSDSNTELVSYPRVLTTSNREVVIRSVINLPILGSNTTTQTTTTTDTQQIEYLPVGTVINVLPKLMPDGAVRLRVTITISNVVGEEQIQGNTYPITSSRVYSGEAVVNSGYTMAIGGLEETKLATVSNKVAALGDIPFFGYFFRSRTADRDHKNLMFFITPTVLNSYDGGLRLLPTREEEKYAEPGNPDNAQPNWRNWTNLNYLANDTPIGAVIDEGLLNALQNRKPDDMVFTELFGYATSGPAVINPLEYPFNKSQVRERDLPPLDPTPDVARANQWPLEVVDRYLGFYRHKVKESAKQETGYASQLNYLQGEFRGADRNKTEIINDRRARIQTSMDSNRSAMRADLNNVNRLLQQKVDRFGQLIQTGELLAGNTKVNPSTNFLKYMTRDEMQRLRGYSYGRDRRYQKDFMTLMASRQKALQEQISQLGQAQRALGFPVTTGDLEKKLQDLSFKVDTIAASW